MIWRIGLRELSRSWGRAVLLGLLLTLTAGMLGGGFVATESLFNTRDAVTERLHLADLAVNVVPVTPEEMPSMGRLRSIDGVRAVNRRYVSYGYVNLGKEPFPVLIVYLDPDDAASVNAVQTLRGSGLDPNANDLAMVHRTFADKKGVAPGSTLTVNPNTFPTTFTIQGVAQSPEYLIPTANPNTLIPSKGSLGIIYASRKKLDETFVNKLYNRIYVEYEEGVDRESVEDRVIAALSGVDVQSVTPRSRNFGYRYLTEDLKGFYMFFPTVAATFALLASIVIFITIWQLLSSRRREIGSIQAIGFSSWQIAGAYLLVSLLPAIVAVALGIPASIELGQFIANAYADVAGLPEVIMTYPTWAFVAAGVTTVIVAFTATILPLRHLFTLEPLSAIRGGGTLQVSTLPAWLRRTLRGARPSSRLSFRNLFRRLGMTLATVALVALAIGLPASMKTSLVSWVGWIDRTIDNQAYDQLVAFKMPVDSTYAKKVRATEGIQSAEPYVTGSGEVSTGSGPSENTRLVGKPVRGNLQRLEIARGRWFTDRDAREIIVNKNDMLTGNLPAVGDSVTVEIDSTTYRLEVAGWANQISIGTAYLPLETARSMMNKHGELTGYAVKIAPDANPDAVRDRLLGFEVVANVQSRTEVAQAMKDYMSSYDVIIDPLIGISVFLSFLFLLTVLSILLVERDDEYATLRSMGVSGLGLCRMIGIEVSIITGIAMVLSAGVWVGLASFFRFLMATAWVDSGLTLRWVDFAVVALPALALMLLAIIPGVWRLLNIDLSRSLHQRAFG